MDIFFCDECGSRVTDPDLRAGRGMRKRHDTICSGCVDQGLAGAWLARAGQANGTKAAIGAAAPAAPAAPVAVADGPDPIAIARDRARTQPEDPFGEAEPAPLKPRPTSGPETDAIPAASAKARPSPRQTPGDDLAAAGGGLGALAALPSTSAGLVDDPEESPRVDDESKDGKDEAASNGHTVEGEDDKGIDVAEVPPQAKPDTPFDFVHPKDNNNPGKSETEEIPAIGPKDETRTEERKSASGRQQSQKRGSTAISKRSPAKAASTRRSGAARIPGNKVILFSLISCAAMLIIFTLVMVNRGSKTREAPSQITEEPYVRLKDATSTAKIACGKAMMADDLPTINHAIACGEEMMRAFNEFEKLASKKGWDDAAYSEALRLIYFPEVKSMLVQVRHRRGIVEQREK